MGYQYEAAIVSAEQGALIRRLDDFARSVPFDDSLRFWLQPLEGELFVIFGLRTSGYGFAGEEVERLARELSRAFGVALAVFYNDRAGDWHPTYLCRAGELVREFDDRDEVWVPYGEDDQLDEGTRYAGNAVPDDVECDCIWNTIDAGLDAAGFPVRIASGRILDAYVSKAPPIWSTLRE